MLTRSATRFFCLILALISLVSVSSVRAANHEHDPNTYTWHPELSTEGPVLVSISLRTQTAAVYRNGIRIGTCRVSTGRPGFETPTGVFYILNKDANHHSKKYNNAPMPYSERLTWEGVALHAGYIPTGVGTSSHGCIHLPYEFARKLFSLTNKGTTVVISKGLPDHFTPKNEKRGFRKGYNTEYVWNPQYSPHGPVSLIFSRGQKKLFILRNGIVIGEAPVSVNLWSKRVHGTSAFVFSGWNIKGKKATPTWIPVDKHNSFRPINMDEWFRVDPRVVGALQGILKKGSHLIVTDEPVSVRTERNFPLIDGLKEAEGQLRINSFRQLDGKKK